jgi:UDP-N-acetylmuramoyl-tripeptide--D-alanyl-D-alanine ligase
MITMTTLDAARLLSAECTQTAVVFNGLSRDARVAIEGTLFVAIQGENFDGHDFVTEAFTKGAAAALVSRKIDCSIPQIIVSDTILALGTLASHWRQRFTLPLIGVTGSNGKTTSKTMIASILTAAAGNDDTRVLATAGNLNNTIGLPFTLALLNDKHQYGVIEMGMNVPGEIKYLTQLTRPQAALLTNAAHAHLQGLGDVAGVAREKGEIFTGLPANGVAVLNRDDDFFEFWQTNVSKHKYITFGFNPAADVSAVEIPTGTPLQQLITLQTPQGKVDIHLQLPGRHNIMNAMAATAAALAIGIDLNAIKEGLENMQPVHGRMNQYLLPNDVCVIDDTYNANPFSTHAAIQTLANFKGKKILVLADMRELGPDAKQLHALTGERALAAGVDLLFTYGELTAATSAAFGKHAQHFTDREQLITALQPHLQTAATILVKGSRSMKMELVVAKLVPEAATAHAH